MSKRLVGVVVLFIGAVIPCMRASEEVPFMEILLPCGVTERVYRASDGERREIFVGGKRYVKATGGVRIPELPEPSLRIFLPCGVEERVFFTPDGPERRVISVGNEVYEEAHAEE